MASLNGLSQIPAKDYQAYFAIGTAIKLPVNRTSTPFEPNGIYINNRSQLTIQVGPSPSGPFTPMGSYTLATFPWVYGRSLYISQIGTASPLTSDFLDVHFLGVPGPNGIGAPQIIAAAPAGWGPVGPTPNILVSVAAGDPFNYGQVQQLIEMLTGTNHGTATLAGNLVANGTTFLNGNVFAAMILTVTGLLTASANLNVGGDIVESGTLRPAGRIIAPAVGASGKPLLNPVPLNTPTGVSVSAVGSHGLTSISIAADVPASAVFVSFFFSLSSTVPSDIVGIFNANPNTNAQAATNGSTGGSTGQLGLPTPQTLWWTTSGTGIFTLTIIPTCYWEPS